MQLNLPLEGKFQNLDLDYDSIITSKELINFDNKESLSLHSINLDQKEEKINFTWFNQLMTKINQIKTHTKIKKQKLIRGS